MVDKKIKMNTFIVEILEQDSFDNFSISQVKDAYVNLCNDKSSSESRKFIYKQILRLVKLGGLTKEGDKNSRSATYKKTYLFSKIKFITRNEFTKLGEINLEDAFINNNIAMNNLETKLHGYNVDMISAIGESEEYIQLAETFPRMKVQLQEKHCLARNRSSKLRGQIKAIKTLIRLQEAPYNESQTA